MLKAKDVMSRNIITVSEDTSAVELAKILYENRISGAPVVDKQGRLVGVVSERDLLNIIFSGNVKTTKVSEIMTKNPVSFTPDTDLDKISLAISERGFRRVIIVDNENKVVGIVSRHDIIKIILEQ